MDAAEQSARGTADSVRDKLEKYLLNPNHPLGKEKARWFEEALGFTEANLEDLAGQLTFDSAQAIQTEVTIYGVKYNQVISILGANNKKIDVTFVWIRNNDDVVRLVTAIPPKRQR